MAAELVVGAVVSASIEFLLGKITSSDAARFLRGKKDSGFDGLLQKLETKLLSLSAVLADAEQKQIRNPAVGKWLDKLQDAVDDAKDLFDEAEYDALKLKVEFESRSSKSKVRDLCSTIFNSTDQKRKSKMRKILSKLEDFEKQMYILNLEEGVRRIPSQRPPSTSLIDDSEVYGRDDEKDVLRKTLLLSDELGGEKMCVIPIVGMGGIGKTTLAQTIYNDYEVNEYFELKAWVCVSDEFDVCKVTKTVLQAVTFDTCTVEDLNVLQVKIHQRLIGKKFLIVLDDVWSEYDDFWDKLRMPFKDGAQGSKIIVTTRSEKVASIMGTVESRRLEELKEEDCLKLFAKYASGNEDYTINSDLERIGRELVEKCKRLPLAVKALGGLFRSMPSEEWERTAKSDILDLPDREINIIPALRLSYHYLPSHLKQCFAYCSIFPKDYEFEKDELVLRWMAESLLEHPKRLNMEMEDVGNEYFNDLVSRSFFQHSSVDRSHFVMHDLMVDLAKSISRKKYFLVEEGKANESVLVKQARHIAYDINGCHNPHEIFKSVSEATCLRTFSPFSQFSLGKDSVKDFSPTSLLPSDPLRPPILSSSSSSLDYMEIILIHDLLKLRCLRYLSLFGYQKVKKLPESVGELKHLRYLDLSYTLIKELPKSLGMLYNLQTLKLSHCFYLKELPKNFHHLINLRYLDVEGNFLVMMPPQISKLKSLQRLSAFAVGGNDYGAKIRELGELSNLKGRLSIYNLQNVVDPHDDALAAKLREKYLEVLELIWDNVTDYDVRQFDVSKKLHENMKRKQGRIDNLKYERDVLDNLWPNTTLKKLNIENYGGTTFPKWLGDHSFCILVDLSLFQCKYCKTLPPLGQLPSLKTLLIANFSAIETVGPEFFGTSSPVVKPFPSLESLTFDRLSNWKKWSLPTENVVAFPELRTLSIVCCDSLTGDLPCVLPSLIELSIFFCSELASELPLMPVVSSIDLRFSKKLPGFQVDHEPFSCLQNLEIVDCEKLEFPLPHTYSSLQKLSISYNSCGFIRSIPLDSFPNIRNLIIEDCQNLESFLQCESLNYLLSLDIRGCPKFTFSPTSNLHCPILTHLELCNCEKLKFLPDHLDSLLPSLQHLMIINCPELESRPTSRLPSSLLELKIDNCGQFVATRKNWKLQALPNLKNFFIIGGGYRCEDMESFPEQGLLPTTITYLRIHELACLKSLDEKGFEELTSLETLDIMYCPNLETLPEEGLPTSLKYLSISRCPLLEQKCKMETGEYWNKIAHIPFIYNNYKPVRH